MGKEARQVTGPHFVIVKTFVFIKNVSRSYYRDLVKVKIDLMSSLKFT